MKKLFKVFLFDLVIMGLFVAVYLSCGFEIAAFTVLVNIHLRLGKR